MNRCVVLLAKARQRVMSGGTDANFHDMQSQEQKRLVWSPPKWTAMNTLPLKTTPLGLVSCISPSFNGLRDCRHWSSETGRRNRHTIYVKEQHLRRCFYFNGNQHVCWQTLCKISSYYRSARFRMDIPSLEGFLTLNLFLSTSGFLSYLQKLNLRN